MMPGEALLQDIWTGSEMSTEKQQCMCGDSKIASNQSLGYITNKNSVIHQFLTYSQEKRFMKLSNTARSVSDIASQASLYIPITMPSSMLPKYVVLDPHSQWHVSGLLSTALESMTLPSRLKLHDGSRQTLDQLVNALNINGNQNIAKLRMSIDQKTALNGNHRPGRLEVRAQSRDMRVPSQERNGESSSPEGESEVKMFDMDFFPFETGEQTRGRHSFKKSHVFGQAESYRAEDTKSTNGNEEDEGYERARRRAAGLPIIQR
jgi:hypothetical protein